MHTVTTVSTVAMMLALLPLGLNGVAAGLSAGAVVGGIYALRQVRTHIGFSLGPMWERIWPPAVASVVMAGVVLGMERLLNAGHNGTAVDAGLIAAGTALGLMVYVGLLAFLAPDTIRELRGAVSIASGRIRRALLATVPQILERGRRQRLDDNSNVQRGDPCIQRAWRDWLGDSVGSPAISRGLRADCGGRRLH